VCADLRMATTYSCSSWVNSIMAFPPSTMYAWLAEGPCRRAPASRVAEHLNRCHRDQVRCDAVRPGVLAIATPLTRGAEESIGYIFGISPVSV
jgi:hypothetical protein